MRLTNLVLTAALLSAVPTALLAQDAAQTEHRVTSGELNVDTFAQQAAQNSLSEVLLSAMALQKSDDKRVDDHAWTMLDHHSRALGDLADALDRNAAPLPSEPSDEQVAELERMRGLDGTAFDQAYFAHQIDAHGKAIQLFTQAGDLSDEMVANYARVTLPILQAHQDITQYRQEQPPQPGPAQ